MLNCHMAPPFLTASRDQHTAPDTRTRDSVVLSLPFAYKNGLWELGPASRVPFLPFGTSLRIAIQHSPASALQLSLS